MQNSVPESLLITLVRHQFLMKVDWPRVRAVEEASRSDELRSVIKYLIPMFASELSPAAAARVEEALIADVDQFGIDQMAEYRTRLDPPRSFSQSVQTWLLTPVLALLQSLSRQKQQKLASNN